MKNVLSETKYLNALKKTGTVILSSILTGSMIVSPILAKASDENPTEKTETVYGVLNADGSVSTQIVSDHIHDEDGIKNIKEELNLTEVENVKTDDEPTVDGNEYTWNLDGTDVYYQGKSTETMPVTVNIKYELDGKTVSADDLKNAKGHLKVTVNFTNNDSKTITSGGKTITVHPFYLAGGILTFDGDTTTNITCNSGQAISDGSDQIVAFMSAPGMLDTMKSAGLDSVVDSLDLSDKCVIEADVTDFTLGDMMLGMTSEGDLGDLADLGDLSTYTSKLSQLFDGADQLLSGSKELADGASELESEAKPLTTAESSVKELIAGALILDEGANQLNDGTQALNTKLPTYTAGVASANQALSLLQYKITTKDPTYNINLLELAQTEADGTKTLYDSVTNFTKGESFKQLQDIIDKSNAELDKMDNAKTGYITLANAYLGDADKGTGLAGTINTLLTTTLPALQSELADTTNTKSLVGIVGRVSAKIQGVTAAISADKEAFETLNGELGTISSTINNLDVSSAINALKQAAAADPANAETYNQAASSLQTSINTIKGLTTTQGTWTDINLDISSELADLKELTTNLTTQLSGLQTTITQAKAALGQLQSIVNSSRESLNTLQGYVNNSKTILSTNSALLTQLTQGAQQLWVGAVNLNSAINGVKDENGNTVTVGIADAINGYTDANGNQVTGLKAGTDLLVSYNNDLTTGTQKLADGTKELAAGTSSLASQKTKLTEMGEGLTSLGTALTTLKEGAETLYEGNVTFNEQGIDQIKNIANLGESDMSILEDVVNAMKDMKQESYSGAPEGAEVSTRFILRTNAE